MAFIQQKQNPLVIGGMPQPIPSSAPPPDDPIASPDVQPQSPELPMIGTGLQKFAMPTLAKDPRRDELGAERTRDEQTLSRLNAPHLGQEGSSMPGIGGKILHGLSTAGNIAGNLFAPGMMLSAPGTQLNNAVRRGQAEKGLAGIAKEEQGDQDSASKRGLEESQARHANVESDLAPATAAADVTEKNAQAANLLHPQAKTEFEAWQAQNPGKPITDWLTAKAQASEKPLATKSTKEQLQAQLVDAQNKGDQATAQKLQKQLKDIDPAGEQRFSFNVGEAGKKDAERADKTDLGTKQAAFKAFSPGMDSAERLNVMTESAEKALKGHDQQAMLNLLANHLGMTMGLQKGARLNQALISEAQNSQPWLQGMQAKWDKDGYLTGVVLTPQQIKQMVSLGQSRFSQDIVKGRNESKYLGAQDDGPERTPNKSTMRYYLGQTNGDTQKAKQMAAEDGWTVK
jgi:ribosomal protein L18